MIIMNQLQKRFSSFFEKSARKGSERGTKYIYLLIGIFVALFLQAFVHNYNIVYMALFFTFAFAYSGHYFGRKNIQALEVKLFGMQRSFVNRQSSYTLALSSNSQRDIYDITCFSQEQTQHINSINAHKISRLEFQHTPLKRGSARLETLRCESHFPLPHQFFFKVFDINKEYDIYPEPKGLSLREFIGRIEVDLADIEDYEGLKEYARGDKLSHIHWKSLSKGKTLLSKEFSYSDERRDLIFDFNSCASSNEERLSQLCLWVIEAEALGEDFTVLMPQDRYDSKKMSCDEILSLLAHY